MTHQTTETQPGNAEDERRFTQADVDRIVQERISRVKRQPPEDYADLQAAAARSLQLEGQLQEAAEQLTTTQQRFKDYATASALIIEATKRGLDADAVIALADRDALEYAEDGTVANASDAVDRLLEDKPYLRGGNGRRTPSADQGARGYSLDGDRKSLALTLLHTDPDQLNDLIDSGRLPADIFAD